MISIGPVFLPLEKMFNLQIKKALEVEIHQLWYTQYN